MAQAHVRLPSGLEVEAFSVHLRPPEVRFDLWAPGAWADAKLIRQYRRGQLSAVLAKASILPSDAAVIVGGDFNAPGRDAIFRLFAPRFHDAFREGGRGWGNTVLNDYPVERFDQVWVSRGLKAMSVVARKSRYSDHRMVIADLLVVSH